MAVVETLNPKAEVAQAHAALAVNISVAQGPQDMLRINLGPKDTMKMLVSGAGEIKCTKDGTVLLHKMKIQLPTASLIAKVATAQDDITGDGTTSNVLIIGELLKQADLYISEGLKTLNFWNKLNREMDRETLIDKARTSLLTKVYAELADVLTEAVVDSILAIKRKDEPIDLFMVELMETKHKSETDTRLIQGLVLDYGACHPDKKKRAENAYNHTSNVSLEYEKTEVNSGFFFTRVCPCKRRHNSLRRAKRRNMERMTLACGGVALNSFDDLNPDCLGHAGLVYEYILGEKKFTFIEKCNNPHSVTLLVKGPNKHTLTQIKDAIRDGLRAVKNAIDDCVVPDGGAVEVVMAEALIKCKPSVKGRAQLGVQVFVDALLIIPKALAQILLFGVDLSTGEPMVAAEIGVWGNYCVKKQLLHSCTVIATNILLVDEIMRAGMASLKGSTVPFM
uniref:T-complex protein 1 subunit zeta n=1 Tax=Nannospalax galili TaxID=1026970 RepID=A0A8C6RWZ5_NANGA